jgi:hypothetical protein
MRVGRIRACGLILPAMAAASFAGPPGKFSIAALKTLEGKEYSMSLAATTNRAIMPFPGETEVRLADTVAGEAGTLYMRKRYAAGTGKEAVEYDGLFRGRPDSARCFQDLNFFRLDSLPFEQAVRFRYYTSADHDWYGDIEEVFFQGPYLLAQASEVYYHPDDSPGKIKRLAPANPAYGCLEIAARPVGSRLVVDGAQRGFTPWYGAVASADMHRIEVSSPGHFPIVHEITVSARKMERREFALAPVPDIKANAEGWSQWIASGSDDPGVYALGEQKARSVRDSLAAERGKSLSRLRSESPRFESLAAESGPERDVRRRRFTHDSLSRIATVSASWDSALMRMDSVIARMNSRRVSEECRPQGMVLPGESINLATYDENLRALPLHFDIRSEHIWSTYMGVILASPAEAREIAARKADIEVKLRYRRIPMSGVDGRPYFFTLEALSLRLDTLLRLDPSGRFAYDRNSWKAPESLEVEKRVRACRDSENKVKAREMKFWSPFKVSTTVAGTVLAAGVAAYFLVPRDRAKKEKIYPVPVDDADK